jgi:hypothetical protein
MSKKDNPGPPGKNPRRESPQDPSAKDGHRIELLKLQRELQRREKEHAAWKAASEPPGSFGGRVPPRKEPGQSSRPRKHQKGESSFFAKLRLGRLLDK